MEGDCKGVMLITANVGSIFEEPETMFPTWLKAFFQCIQTHKPGFVALHCQEVGGKNYEASMQHVNQFIKTLLACEELHKYDRATIFLDEDYTASDKFTALGNLYFIHEEVSDVLIWDFVGDQQMKTDKVAASYDMIGSSGPIFFHQNCKFIEVQGREVLSGSIESIPIKEKDKFPQYFFPEFKWSRKGFLRTRWSINNCIFDLVNIHLFHDASNIVAMETSPSVYLENRQRALLHTLQRFENDKYSNVPLFIFGDFNFRLDSNLLIQELTEKLVASQTKGKKGQVNKIEYTELDTGKIVLTVGSKSFDYYDRHSDLFTSMNKWLHQYDTEFFPFHDRLFEHDISFPPSYPFCEDVSDGISYMKTRVPSWCDRVLLTHSAKDIISQPAYLFISMTTGKGNCEQQNRSSYSFTTNLLSPKERKRSLSINGELIEGINLILPNVDLSSINIHDYAIFENEKSLLPEFKKTIIDRKVTKKVKPENNNHLTSSQPKVMNKRSFQEIAREVVTLESVLLQWPKRPPSHHHSSSSEDFPSENVSKDVISNETKRSDRHNLSAESETAHCSSKNVNEYVREVNNQKDNINQETNNNKDSTEPAPENGQIKYHPDSVVCDTGIQLQNLEINWDSDKSSSAFSEVAQLIGCGDGDKAVVLLAQQGSLVHVDSSAPPASSVPQLASQSYQGEPSTGKTGKVICAPSSSSGGCCSCVVL